MAFNPNIPGYSTQGKSFSRTAAFPLECYEIWTDFDALVEYAKNTDPSKDPSYIGQKVAYIDTTNNKVVHYGIELDGSLKELGADKLGIDALTALDAGKIPQVVNVVDTPATDTEPEVSHIEIHWVTPAPADAQANKIEVIKVNGTPITINNKAVDITIPTKLSDLEDDLPAPTDYTVTVTARADQEGDDHSAFKHYIFKQCNKEIGHIDIPKDLVVDSGSIGTVTKANDPYTGAVIGDKYIDLKIANQTEHLYIPAKSLVDIYTAQADATQVQLNISDNNEISATLVDGSITIDKLDAETLYSYTQEQFNSFVGSSETLDTYLSDTFDELVEISETLNDYVDDKFDELVENSETLFSYVNNKITDFVENSDILDDYVNNKINTTIQDLDVEDITGMGAGKTIATLTETDGKIAATFQDIEITTSQISDFEAEKNVINGLAQPITGEGGFNHSSITNRYLEIDSDRNLDVTGFAKQGIVAGNYIENIITAPADTVLTPFHSPVLWDGIVGGGVTSPILSATETFIVVPGRTYDVHIGELPSPYYDTSKCFKAVATESEGSYHKVLFELPDGKRITITQTTEAAPAGGIDEPFMPVSMEVLGFEEPTHIYITSELIGLGIEKGAEVNKINAVSDEFNIVTDADESKDRVLEINKVSVNKIEYSPAEGENEAVSLLDFLDGKANTIHTHNISDVEGFDEYALTASYGIGETIYFGKVWSADQEISDTPEISLNGKIKVNSTYVIKFANNINFYLKTDSDLMGTQVAYYKQFEWKSAEHPFLMFGIGGDFEYPEDGAANVLSGTTLMFGAQNSAEQELLSNNNIYKENVQIYELIPFATKTVATTTDLGLVKSTTVAYEKDENGTDKTDHNGNKIVAADSRNKVTVDKNGIMEIAAISADRIVQTGDTWLILNGGNASLN